MTDRFEDVALLDHMVEAARAAGVIALADFRVGAPTTARVESKEGGSPVTDADRRADDFLRDKLATLAPDAGWLSEETADNAERLAERLSRERVFIVDPIDGTRAFMAGDPRWAVCVALVERGQPIVGIVHLPARAETYVAAAGRGATLNGAPIAVSARPSLAGSRIAAPMSVLKALAATGLAFETEPRIPSLAYRLTRVADGGLDAGIASTNAHDWDIAAADVILREAGGVLTDIDGRAPLYNNRMDTRHPLLCAAARRLHGELADALRRSLGGGARS